LTTPSLTPLAEPTHKPPVRKKVLWKWSIGVTVVILTFLMWQCGFALVQGRKLANVEVTHFHERLNAEQYEDICRNADEGFKAKQSQEELIKFLAAVHKKLGKAGVENQINIRVDTNTNGTFLTTWYNTEFASGTATETFTWRKSNGSWRLLGYNVQSAALLN
jgi:hypothetical protein